MEKYVIGLDFGTDSVRALIVNAYTGEQAGSAESFYTRWKRGMYCDPGKNVFRQHPSDYIEGMEQVIIAAIEEAGEEVRNSIKALSVDTTGSTPVAVDSSGTPLSLLPSFRENPNAMFVLWKDHSAIKEAEEINWLAKNWNGEDYTRYEGGIYSSEWFWAKVLHVLREDEKIREAAFSWVEHCDWIPAMLSGTGDVCRIKRSRCAAGHKAMWHTDWGGLPPEEFLVRLDPLLKGLRERLYKDTYTSDAAAGILSTEWASRLGLPGGTVVGTGAFDAHLGAVGGEIKPFYLSKVMGTSTCDMITVPAAGFGSKLVKGICGQVDGSIIPGMIGLEAGQSAFGDVYAWFRDLMLWPLRNLPRDLPFMDNTDIEKLTETIHDGLISQLSKAAEDIDPENSGVMAIDWLNGRRTPDANQMLKGAVGGLSLGTDAPAIFRALVESTAFGARRIVDRFRDEGIRIDGVIALGGVAKKSDFVMQIVTDVLDMPVSLVRSEQTCALGSAMAASVAAGIHDSFETAQQAMGNGFEKEFHPRPHFVEKYKSLYNRYIRFSESVEQMETGKGPAL
jgi:L-ribulokinase